MSDLTPYHHNGALFPKHTLGYLDGLFSDSWPSFRRSNYEDKFRLDVREEDKKYLIEADLPGTDKSEVSLDMNYGRLTISVNKNRLKDEEKENYICRERVYTSMSRSVYLPDADETKVEARLENGVLKVIAPKKEGSRKRGNIEIL